MSAHASTEYQDLCRRNSDMMIYNCTDTRFQTYGCLWPGFDLADVEEWAKTVSIPESGNAYTASDPTVEQILAVQSIGSAVYGGQPFQAGPCCGRNRVLNGIEYHNGSETAICLTSCVMFLGRLQDMREHTYDGTKAEAFYFPAGSVVQTYETTLHYTPCAVDTYFFTVCFLPKGTGAALPDGPRGILKRQNKWFIAHPDNTAKVQAGDFPGLTGKMRELL